MSAICDIFLAFAWLLELYMDVMGVEETPGMVSWVFSLARDIGCIR